MKRLVYTGEDGKEHELPIIGKPYKIGRLYGKRRMGGGLAGFICGLCALAMLVLIRLIVG